MHGTTARAVRRGGGNVRTQDERDEDRVDARMAADEAKTPCDDCGKRVMTLHSGPGGMRVCGCCLRAYLP